MTHRNPPLVASWLLNRFAGDSQSLMGDMFEEYRNGRTVGWYWRQTVIAVARSTVAQTRSHWPLAIRASILTLLYFACYMYFVNRPLALLYSGVLWKINPAYFFPEHSSFGGFLAFSFFPGLLLPCLGCVTGGWIVARLHRPYGAAFTVVNAFVLFSALIVLFVAVELNHSTYLFLRDEFSFRVLFYLYVLKLKLLMIFAVSTLLGGLLSNPTRNIVIDPN